MKVVLIFYLLVMANINMASPVTLFEGNLEDASTAYLSMIFGVVEGVLHGTGSQIAGQLFSLLSTILFCFAGTLWTYTTFVSILNTTAQGQFLGQKWSSMWVPLRVLGGFCLLMPKGATGYSLIQVIVMSVVLKGVAAANQVWSATLDYLQAGGTIVETTPFFKAEQYNSTDKLLNNEIERDEYAAKEKLLQVAGKVLKSEVYMMSLASSDSTEPYPYSKTALLNFPLKQTTHGYQTIQLPSVDQIGLCGTIRWLPSPQLNTSAYYAKNYDLRGAAVQRMVLDVLPSAERIAQRVMNTDVEKNVAGINTRYSTAPPNHFVSLKESFALVKAAQNVIGMLKVEARQKALAEFNDRRATLERLQQKLRRGGWLLAGSYYWVLAESNQQNTQLKTDWTAIINNISVNEGDANIVRSHLSQESQRQRFDQCLRELDRFIEAEKERLSSYYTREWITHPKAQTEPDYIKHWLLDPFQSSSIIFQKRMQSILDQQKDPIIALSAIGKELLQAVEQMWKEINEGTLRINGLIPEYQTAGEWFKVSNIENLLGSVVKFLALAPILSMWMLLNFTLGSLLVYYVPLIPFLIFFSGSLTWFGLVIVGIIASPFAAVGLMSPEGHDIFGQSEQATRLLASLFLRPLLMLFGLILGMMLCTVVFELFHYSYGVVIERLPKFSGVLSGVSQIANTSLYTLMAINIVTRCFALIYELPNRVFSWIGWQLEGHHETEILGQAKGGIDQHVGGVSQEVTRGVFQAASSSHSPAAATSQNNYHATIYHDNQ